MSDDKELTTPSRRVRDEQVYLLHQYMVGWREDDRKDKDKMDKDIDNLQSEMRKVNNKVGIPACHSAQDAIKEEIRDSKEATFKAINKIKYTLIKHSFVIGAVTLIGIWILKSLIINALKILLVR